MRRYNDFLGQVLNQSYRLDSLIKVGGMGAVFRGTHTRLPKRLAIKVLHLDPEAYPDVVTRFQREAEITASLHHPHIVEVADFNVSDGVPYLVMELLEGEDLDHRLRRQPPLTIGETLALLEQVTSALDAAHRGGVVHRDVKPSNIFLCGRADAAIHSKVLDFGVSKIMGVQSNVTGTHASIGTPRYMAPEQARGRAGQVDARTDVFAIATIAYEIFAGVSPFDGDSIPEVLYQIVHEDPVSLAERRPDLPLGLVSAIHHGMAKDPAGRQASMAEFWRELNAGAEKGLQQQPTQIGEAEELEPTKVAGGFLEVSAPSPPTEHALGGGMPSLGARPSEVVADPRLRTGPRTPAEQPTVTGPPLQPTVTGPPLRGRSPMAAAGKPEPSFDPLHQDPTMIKPEPSVAAVMAPPPDTPAAVRPSSPGLPVILGACAVTLLVVGVGVLLYLWVSDPEPSITTRGGAAAADSAPQRAESPDARAPVPADALRVDSRRPDASSPRRLWITSTPSQARVLVGGRELGKTPLLGVALPLGVTSVVLRLRGYRPLRLALPAAVTEPRLSVSLKRVAARRGTLRVMTTSGGASLWAEIFIDGKKVGVSPLARPIRAGRHRVQARRAGYGSQQKTVSVAAGGVQRVTFDLKKR